MRCARTSTIFALPCEVSVRIPACDPVSETASWPRSWIAIAQSAFEIRSPTERSMSYSRGCGCGETSCASLISSSVVSPIAERTPTTRWPASWAATSRRATSLIFCTSPTDVPPNFFTRRSTPRTAASAASCGISSCWLTATARVCLHVAAARKRAVERDFVGVLEVAADGETAREPRHPHASAQAVGEIGGGRLPGHVRVRREHDFLDAVALDPVHELVDAQVFWLDAVERRERATEDVVQAAVLGGSLERDQVDRLFDDADRRAVATRVEADRAELLLGEVAAFTAEADALLDLVDRVGERLRLGLRHLEEMKCQALRRPCADSGQPRQLRDEILDGRAEHPVSLVGRSGHPGQMPGWTTPSRG